MRDYYVTSMFPERLLTTFVATLPKEHEVWICFPTQGDVGELKSPDRAIVWNYHDDTMSITDLPQCRDMDQGVIIPDLEDFYDSILPADLTYDQDTLRYDESPFSTALDFMVGAHGQSLSVFGEEPTDDGTPRECIAERTGLVLKDEKSGMMSVDAIHRVRTARLYIQSTQPIAVQLGGQNNPAGSVFWDPEQMFDPATQSYLKFRPAGRYFGYRVRSNADVKWSITDIEFEYHRLRRR
jgi:hypothetical protein